MTGTRGAKVEWKSGASIDYDTGVSHDGAERNRAAQCANATHCSRLEKLALVTGANNGGAVADRPRVALENYIAIFRPLRTPRFRKNRLNWRKKREIEGISDRLTDIPRSADITC